MFCIILVSFKLTTLIRNITFNGVLCPYSVPYPEGLSSFISGHIYPTKVVVEDTFLTPNGSHAYYTITNLFHWETPIPK
jgi:hypothetical protein